MQDIKLILRAKNPRLAFRSANKDKLKLLVFGENGLKDQFSFR